MSAVAAAPAASVTEEVLRGEGVGLQAAAKLLPSARQGRPVNYATLFRWVVSGIRLADGRVVRLEACKLSGRWLTSRGALSRFISAQTPDLAGAGPAAAPPRPPSERRRSSAAADAELRRRGC